MAVENPTDTPDTPPTTQPTHQPGNGSPSRAPEPGSRAVRWIAALAAVVVIGAGVVFFFPGLLGLGESDGESGALTYTASRGPLQVTVKAQGNVESASNVDVKCRVAGGATILWIVEDGKFVEEGDVIVRMDTSTIEDNLNSQRIVYERALAAQIQAQEAFEAATIAVKEYEEGTFVEQFKQVEADIRVAMENLRSAENQLEYSKRMARKGFVSALQREADEFALERAKLDLDVAQTRKHVLVEFTKQKMLKDLVAAREASAANVRAEDAGLRLEKARLERLEKQLEYCVIIAPQKGMVVYANESRGRFGGNEEARIEEGAIVRESQTLVQLPDLTDMEVKLTVHESRVDQVRPGLPARITIQGEEYTGKVLSVANQPERSSFFSANVKEYATVVSIEGETTGLRPGMTAQVTVLIANSTDALTVPVSAVVEQQGKFFCWTRTPSGPERRELTLGMTNDKLIEIVDGVKEGDLVLRNPRAVVEDARRDPPFEQHARGVEFDASVSVDSSDAPAEPPRDRGAGSRGDERGGGGGGPGRGRFDLMQFDADGDGKLGREELPEGMREMFDSVDSDGDGSIGAVEIEAMRQRFGGGRDGGGRDGGGPRGGRDGREGRGGPAPGGERPDAARSPTE